jgi:hypothetical protein
MLLIWIRTNQELFVGSGTGKLNFEYNFAHFSDRNREKLEKNTICEIR